MNKQKLRVVRDIQTFQKISCFLVNQMLHICFWGYFRVCSAFSWFLLIYEPDHLRSVLFYTINFYVFTKNNSDPLLQVIWVEKNEWLILITTLLFLEKNQRFFFTSVLNTSNFQENPHKKKPYVFLWFKFPKVKTFVFVESFKKKFIII